MSKLSSDPEEPMSAPMLGDHPALDLVNTLAMVDGKLVDFLQSDADVIAWLSAQSVKQPAIPALAPMSLLSAAKQLRGLIKAAVEKRKAGKAIKTGELNALLRMGAGYPALHVGRDGTVTLSKSWGKESAEQVLGPIIESAAELLAHANFDLFRACEDEACVLWFYDRTKSHRRRWCSAATCGNRNKVAAFRARKQNAGL